MSAICSRQTMVPLVGLLLLSVSACTDSNHPTVPLPNAEFCSVGGGEARQNGPVIERVSNRQTVLATGIREIMREMHTRIPKSADESSDFVREVSTAYFESVVAIATRQGRDPLIARTRAESDLVVALDHSLTQLTGAARTHPETARARRFVDSLKATPRVASHLALLQSVSSTAIPDSQEVMDFLWDVAGAAADTTMTSADAASLTSSIRDVAIVAFTDTMRARELMDAEAALDTARAVVSDMALEVWVNSGGTYTPIWSCSKPGPVQVELRSMVEECPYCLPIIKTSIRTGWKWVSGGAVTGVIGRIMWGEHPVSGEELMEAAGQGAAGGIVAGGLAAGLAAYGGWLGGVMVAIIQAWL